MISRLRMSSKHRTAKTFIAVTMALALVFGVIAGIGAGKAHGQGSTAARGGTLKGSLGQGGAAHGTFDLSKAPTMSAASAASAASTLNLNGRAGVNRPLPTAARAKQVGRNTSVVHGGATAIAPSRTTPSFISYSPLPPLAGNIDGLNSTQSGGWNPPDQAVGVAGTSPGGTYVIEGVNNAFNIYNASYGHVAGPYATSTMFASVMVNGDFFSDPQITFDASRLHWVFAYIELTPGSCAQCINHAYIDIAVSKAFSPLGVPTNYNVYQFDVTGQSQGMCDYPTLGMDYWNIYVTCAEFATASGSTPGGWIGNRIFMFTKADLYAGAGVHWGWFYNLPNDLNCGSGAGTCIAFRVAPATEDGAPQAEWVIATDAAYSGASQNLTLMAITGSNALSTGHLPTATYLFGSLPGFYADPPGAAQPGTTTTLYTGLGVKQFVYKGGRLWFSFTTDVLWNGDSAHHAGVYWAVIQPVLSTLATHTPQWVAGWYNIQQSYHGYVGWDTFMPSIMPSDEGDIALVFNASNGANFPSIFYSGQQNTDGPNTMVQGSNDGAVVWGSASNDSGRWGDYSACALNIQPTTRSFVFCGGEYGGANTALGTAGWNTRIYTIRLE